jgi:hypothetical protein
MEQVQLKVFKRCNYNNILSENTIIFYRRRECNFYYTFLISGELKDKEQQTHVFI